MAFTVNFYTFSKRINSTAVPNNPVISVQCSLKDNSGIINPILEISTSVNPQALNYAYIPQFDRYYWVNDWTWILGRWEVTLNIDVLGSYRSQIGSSSHYVLRSSYRYNQNLVDDLYPALAWQPNYYIDTESFNFATSILDGTFVIGVVNRQPENFGAVSYYTMTASQIHALIRDMLPTASETWLQGFSQMTDTLYRSIYSPFDYIKSCKWFPVDIRGTGNDETMYFGNYESNATGRPIRDNTLFWYDTIKDVYLPTSWISLDAKYRVQPYAHIYLYCNPWGVIELNPLDFTDSRIIHLVMQLDYINGDAILKIYKTVGTTNYFIVQKVAKLAIDITLSQSSIDVSSLTTSTLGAGVGITSLIAASNPAGIIAGGITAGAGVFNAILSTQPTMGNSVGVTANSIKGLGTGEIMLIYTSTYFASEDNTENGKPLCETVTLNSIPGYIKCLHGEMSIDGAYNEELSMISEFLTNGFFFE